MFPADPDDPVLVHALVVRHEDVAAQQAGSQEEIAEARLEGGAGELGQ